MTQMESDRRVLVATVGTGNLEDLENTLLVPMGKSIEEGDWVCTVLLPSQRTEEMAELVQRSVGDRIVTIESLPAAGLENDADGCFGHFDSVLAKLIADGFSRERITVDFTRGTKAMSAALVLAAARHDIPFLRYIHGERDGRGIVQAGNEKIGKIRTARVTARRRLDGVMDLMRHGDFGAAIVLLPVADGPFSDLLPVELRQEAHALRAASEIYAAWDRLDYGSALEAWRNGGADVAEAFGGLAPTPEMHDWLKCLDHRPENEDDHASMARYLRILCCDLLANAERRLRASQLEDTLLRAYRILELIGQFRLFDRGYHSSGLPGNDEKIAAFQEKLERKKDKKLGERPNGQLTAGREQTARLLKHLGDPIAEGLLKFDKKHAVETKRRNISVLVHGFEAKAPSAPELKRTLAGLEALLWEDDPTVDDRLVQARRLDFSSG